MEKTITIKNDDGTTKNIKVKIYPKQTKPEEKKFSLIPNSGKKSLKF